MHVLAGREDEGVTGGGGGGRGGMVKLGGTRSCDIFMAAAGSFRLTLEFVSPSPANRDEGAEERCVGSLCGPS